MKYRLEETAKRAKLSATLANSLLAVCSVGQDSLFGSEDRRRQPSAQFVAAVGFGQIDGVNQKIIETDVSNIKTHSIVVNNCFNLPISRNTFCNTGHCAYVALLA